MLFSKHFLHKVANPMFMGQDPSNPTWVNDMAAYETATRVSNPDGWTNYSPSPLTATAPLKQAERQPTDPTHSELAGKRIAEGVSTAAKEVAATARGLPYLTWRDFNPCNAAEGAGQLVNLKNWGRGLWRLVTSPYKMVEGFHNLGAPEWDQVSRLNPPQSWKNNGTIFSKADPAAAKAAATTVEIGSQLVAGKLATTAADVAGATTSWGKLNALERGIGTTKFGNYGKPTFSSIYEGRYHPEFKGNVHLPVYGRSSVYMIDPKKSNAAVWRHPDRGARWIIDKANARAAKNGMVVVPKKWSPEWDVYGTNGYVAAANAAAEPYVPIPEAGFLTGKVGLNYGGKPYLNPLDGKTALISFDRTIPGVAFHEVAAHGFPRKILGTNRPLNSWLNPYSQYHYHGTSSPSEFHQVLFNMANRVNRNTGVTPITPSGLSKAVAAQTTTPEATAAFVGGEGVETLNTAGLPAFRYVVKGMNEPSPSSYIMESGWSDLFGKKFGPWLYNRKFWNK